VAVAKMVFVH